MDRHYTVRGRWPFPLDMLRRDQSEAATPEDQAKIEYLSTPHLESLEQGSAVLEIRLVIRNTERGAPNYARWRSFGGWQVIDDDDKTTLEWEAYQQRQKEIEAEAKLETLRASGLAKLTPDEREALGV